jgi:predicted amidohydrolase/NH3-dependent NAD+ synthetase
MEAADTLSKTKTVRVATCTLSQFVLQYKENTDRIIESIKAAKAAGCTYRIGPELEISGYSCEDHFYESDTLDMSWYYLGTILEKQKGELEKILCDIGTLVMHNGVRYNCRVFCLNGKIVLIRPKMYLADDGNYRENRWFTGWPKSRIQNIEDCILPENIQEITKQRYAKFGVAIIECFDGVTIASEICEELFTPESPNIMLGLEGVDIISNGSGSHFQLGKRERRHQLIGEATKKNGGAYLYSNLVGCDGNRMVFDGNSMVYVNGKLVVCGEHLTWHDVETVIATIDLNDVRSFRWSNVSRNEQSVNRDIIVPRIKICDCFEGGEAEKCANFKLSSDNKKINVDSIVNQDIKSSFIIDDDFKSVWKLGQLDSKNTDKPFAIVAAVTSPDTAKAEGITNDTTVTGDSSNTVSVKSQDTDATDIAAPVKSQDTDATVTSSSNATTVTSSIIPMELGDEIGLYTSRWVWDYTIRCGAGGYLLPLSGGVDSTATAMVIYYMCDKIAEFIKYTDDKSIEGYNKTRLKNHITDLLNNGFLNEKYKWNVEAELKDKNIATLDTNDLMFILLHTANMPTKYNSEKTANSAAILASKLNCYHMTAPIQKGFEGFVDDSKITTASNGVNAATIENGDVQFGYYKWEKKNEAMINSSAKINDAKINDDKFKWEEENQIIIPQEKHTDKGDTNQGLARQNIQARLRMLTAYYLAQILPIYRRAKRLNLKTNSTKFTNENKTDRQVISFLLVLASSNADEALRGFYTKYDAASADINPIGSLSKTHLRQYLEWCITKWNNKFIYNETNKKPQNVIKDVLDTLASPELTASTNDDKGNVIIQDDEIEIGMTYEQLFILGKLRKEELLGPIAMFKRLCDMWVNQNIKMKFIRNAQNEPDPKESSPTPMLIFQVVKVFFGNYYMHRNKMTILTPSVHGTSYSPDDNRFDQRPIFYPSFWDSNTTSILKEIAKKKQDEYDEQGTQSVQDAEKTEQDAEKTEQDAQKTVQDAQEKKGGKPKKKYTKNNRKNHKKHKHTTQRSW